MRERLLDAQDELERLRGAGAEGSRLAEAYGALGMQLHALALLDVARDAYAAAARLDGADPRWPCYLGAVEERRNDPAAAERRNAACVELRPDYVAGWVRLGQVRSERGDAAGARDAFRRALALDARCAAAMAGLGTLAAREKRHEEARDLFEQALAIAPEADNLHFHLAMAYRALGDAERAARHMERRGEVKVGVRDPLLDRIDALVSGVRGYTELGERLGRAGRYDEAAAALEQAVAADPDDALAHLYLGFVRTRQGRLDDALASFARVRELEPDNERAWFFAGRVHVARGEDAEALAAFREAVRLHPRQARARLELGLQLQRAGEHAAAADELDRAVALDPANAQARLARAFALVRLGRWAGAREALEDDVRTLPDEPAFLHALARILAAAPDAEVRDGTRGLALAEQLSRSMQNLDLAETVGMALAEAGRVDEAARWQRDLIDLARGSGAVGRLPRLRRQLASYEHGGGWREPWDRDDPVFTPTRPGAPITVDEMAAREEGTQPE
jgi:tetratricopeptide (TPR) repeat protein